MKYYKDGQEKLFSYEDNVKEDQVESGLTSITKDEFDAILVVQNTPTSEELQEKSNAEARAYLASTDWYIIRLQETGEAVPTVPVDVLQARIDARASVVDTVS